MTNHKNQDEPLDELGRLLLELKQATVATYVTAGLVRTLGLDAHFTRMSEVSARQVAAEKAIRDFVNAQARPVDTDPDGDHL